MGFFSTKALGAVLVGVLASAAPGLAATFSVIKEVNADDFNIQSISCSTNGLTGGASTCVASSRSEATYAFPRFDDALGTLNSVTLSWDINTLFITEAVSDRDLHSFDAAFSMTSSLRSSPGAYSSIDSMAKQRSYLKPIKTFLVPPTVQGAYANQLGGSLDVDPDAFQSKDYNRDWSVVLNMRAAVTNPRGLNIDFPLFDVPTSCAATRTILGTDVSDDVSDDEIAPTPCTVSMFVGRGLGAFSRDFGDIQATYAYAPAPVALPVIPLPATMPLLVAALGGLAIFRRRRGRAA